MDTNLICKFFLQTERQGPGSPDTTLKALSFIDNLTNESHIIDMGCGTGSQTMVLAQNTSGAITGLDLFPDFIDKLNQTARTLHLQNHVKGIVASMDNLPFQRESIDLIWSEGAIYNIGFERGIKEWRNFLKPGGYIAVSEISWLTEQRPAEINNFWTQNYEGIDTISVKTEQMQKAGYTPIATFVIPEHCWTKHYYRPLAQIRKQISEDKLEANKFKEFFEDQQLEESLYYTYKQYYGYVFYIGKKI